MNLFKLINLFRKTNGRSPSPNELAMLKRQVSGVDGDNVIQFPGGDKSGIKSLDEFTKSENIYEQSMKPKGARPGNINYEAMQEKFPDVKLYGDESFQELLDIEKTGKHPRDKAAGGRIGFSVGGAKGLAHMLGEGPRSMYGYGGGAGMPPVTHDDNVDNIGPGTMNPGSRPRLNVMPQMRPGKYMENKMNQRPMQNLANGGRISFAGGGLSRRAFLKLLGAGTATVAAAKTGILGLLKGKKAATGVKVLSNTTTTMPTWFPDLVDKMMVRGIGKKIDADIIEYKTKDLPGITMTKHDDGRIFVEGQNDYGRNYNIEYEPPGVELLDETTGKSVKTKGDFTAQEEVPVNMDPDGNTDFDGEILESVDDILTGDSRSMEGFATGKKIKDMKRGEFKVGQAEKAAEQAADEAAELADDFAKGGLAKLLGE